MRKLTPYGFSLLIIILGLILIGIFAMLLFQDGMEPGESDPDALILDSNITKGGMIKEPKIEEKILVEFLSVNYLEDKEYLMRVEVGGVEIGIIYFDEKGEIRFDGDKEKFEEAIFKAFDARRVK